MSFGVATRNGLAIGLGTIATLGVVTAAVNPPDPGPPWIVLSSDGTSYICSNVVLDSSGVAYTVVSPVLDSSGNSYNPI